MADPLVAIYAIMQQLRETPSLQAKASILESTKESCPQFMQILKWTYNPEWMYYQTSKALTKDWAPVGDAYPTASKLLSALSKREITGQAAINHINTFVSKKPEWEVLLSCILDKDLNVGIGEKLINSVWKGLIPVFPCSKGKAWKDLKKYPVFEREIYFASRKFDGLRGTAIKEEADVNLYSSSGIIVQSLEVITDALRSIGCNFMLDGEMCIVDENGKEDFNKAQSEISRKKGHQVKNPRYIIFDILELSEFRYEEVSLRFSERLKLYEIFYKQSLFPSPFFGIAKQVRVQSTEHLNQMYGYAMKMGWEGIVLRKGSSAWHGTRTDDIIKLKPHVDAEFEVVDVIRDREQSILINGVRTEVKCMDAAVIIYEGKKVNVGGGWKQAELLYYNNHPEELIGKVITVQFMQECHDKKGELSLRHPRKKTVHGAIREF